MSKQKPKVDLSKVDLGNDFRDFPQIFNNPEDIEKFISERCVDVPVLKNLLTLRKLKQLDITPTEDEFYFSSMFDYIYDVFRVPVPETFIRTIDWLKYIESNLVQNGFTYAKRQAYESVSTAFEARLRFEEIFKDRIFKKSARDIKEINNHKDIDLSPYYNHKDPTLIESFWIKSSRWSGQPVIVGEEAYMRAHVFPNRVYIMGCDDCSWTLETKTKEEAKAFARFLKCAAPIWNFSFPKSIHHELEFTN